MVEAHRATRSGPPPRCRPQHTRPTMVPADMSPCGGSGPVVHLPLLDPCIDLALGLGPVGLSDTQVPRTRGSLPERVHPDEERVEAVLAGDHATSVQIADSIARICSQYSYSPSSSHPTLVPGQAE
eukprot:8033690-Prorocentrum_lima.AAC.1